MLMLTDADVDECSTGWHRCPSTATCQNVVGQYLCHCGYGFYGDRKTCHRQYNSTVVKEFLMFFYFAIKICFLMFKKISVFLFSPNIYM